MVMLVVVLESCSSLRIMLCETHIVKKELFLRKVYQEFLVSECFVNVVIMLLTNLCINKVILK